MESKKRYVFCVKPEDGQNFWDANEELQYLSPYAEFKEELGKRKSGRIMTAIWMIYDPKSRANQAGDRKREDVIKDISTNYLKDKNFPWDEYSKITGAFKRDCKTKLEHQLDDWEDQLIGRANYQKRLPWETESEKKDKLLATQSKLYEDFRRRWGH